MGFNRNMGQQFRPRQGGAPNPSGFRGRQGTRGAGFLGRGRNQAQQPPPQRGGRAGNMFGRAFSGLGNQMRGGMDRGRQMAQQQQMAQRMRGRPAAYSGGGRGRMGGTRQQPFRMSTPLKMPASRGRNMGRRF